MATTKSSKIPKALKFLTAAVAIIGASISATMFYYEKSGFGIANAQSLGSEAIPLPAPIFAALDPFTVTLSSDRSQHILHVGITLRMTDEPSRSMVSEYMPEVRDRVLRRLAEQHPDVVQTPEGRRALVESLTDSLKQPYSPHSKGPDITSVLFTAFVVQ